MPPAAASGADPSNADAAKLAAGAALAARFVAPSVLSDREANELPPVKLARALALFRAAAARPDEAAKGDLRALVDALVARKPCALAAAAADALPSRRAVGDARQRRRYGGGGARRGGRRARACRARCSRRRSRPTTSPRRERAAARDAVRALTELAADDACVAPLLAPHGGGGASDVVSALCALVVAASTAASGVGTDDMAAALDALGSLGRTLTRWQRPRCRVLDAEAKCRVLRLIPNTNRVDPVHF